MENLEAIAVIIGVVSGVKLALAADKTAFYYFLSAVVAGIVFGFLGWFGLTLEAGLVAALASAGVYQVGKRVGGQ